MHFSRGRSRHTNATRLLLSAALICLTWAVSHAAAKSKPECTVFVTHYMQRCTASTLPSDGRPYDTLNIFASPGEYEPCTFSIRANEPVAGVSVEVSDLKGKGGIIPKKNVVVRKVDIWTRKPSAQVTLNLECYLPKLTVVDIPKDTTQRFWLTVHVPDTAAPGDYAAKITLKAQGKPFKTLDLRLNVLRIKLLPPEGMAYFMYHGVHFAPTYTRNLRYNRMCLLDQKAHGMTTTTAYFWTSTLPDGSVELDSGRNPNALPAGKQLRDMMAIDLVGPGIPVIWIGSAESGDTQLYEAVLAEAQKRGWPEILFYVVDEPVTKEAQERVRQIMAKIDEVRAKHPDLKIRTTTAINNVAADVVGQYYDIWILYTPDVCTYSLENAKKAGKELWCYDCSFAPVDAVTSRYCYGVWAWKTGLKGVSHWAYADVGGAYGDKGWDWTRTEQIQPQSFVWPTPSEPVPSIGWEGVREGVDDYRYLTTLKAAITKARAAGKSALADQAQQVLTDVESRINVDGYQRAYVTSCKRDPKQERQDFVYNRVPPEPEIAPAGYDALRRQIADQIIKLTGGL